ncbi:hypothetical protein GQ457_03G006580 [Hibiscus cannabinus]
MNRRPCGGFRVPNMNGISKNQHGYGTKIAASMTRTERTTQAGRPSNMSWMLCSSSQASHVNRWVQVVGSGPPTVYSLKVVSPKPSSHCV